MVMAKTIKELAEEYAYTNWQSDDYHDGAAEGLEFDAIGHTEKTYLAGANAVLMEVEKIINKHYHSEINWEMSLRGLIKQLKGEQL